MSNLFKRPEPKTATAVDVKNAIEEITNWDWETGYSFAHSVIDDKNLDDGDILYCLRPSWIAETMNQKIQDELGFEPDFDKLERWQWGIIERPIRHMAEIIDLLNWLLDVPAEVRDQVDD